MKTALRLRRPADFARVRRSGIVFRHPAILISLCQNAISHNRYGIVTSKRLGNAVVRNRCKRRLRAILMCLHDELRQGFDVVVLARSQINRQPFGDLQRIVSGLLAQARLMGNC